MNINLIIGAVLFYEHYNSETSGFFMNIAVLREEVFMNITIIRQAVLFYEYYNTERGDFVL
jgi:hypothetical protein